VQVFSKSISRVCAPALVILATLVALEQTSHALCFGGTYNRRVSVGTLPDVFFTAGVPTTQYIKPVKVNFESPWAPDSVYYADCQAYARSNVSGVSIQESYGNPGTVIGPGAWATIDQSSGPPPEGAQIQYYRTWGYPDYLSGQIPIIYDGTGSPRVGNIDIAVNQGDEFHISMRYIARVNVYIVAGDALSSAFTVTSTASTVSGDSLTLNHPLLNQNGNTKVFAQHYSSGATWNHPIAVWYDTSLRRWKIRNEDGTAMLAGLTFSVRVDPSAMVIHTSFTDQPSYLIIQHPESDGNPYANIVVTPMSAGNRRMTQPFAVAYVHPYWEVYFASGDPMPTSYIEYRPGFHEYRPGFHVKVNGATHNVDDLHVGDPSGFLNTELSNGAGIDIVASSGRMSGNKKFLSHWCWTVNSGVQPIITTFNGTPLPPPAPVNYNWVQSKHYGVGVIGNIAIVFHEDGSFMDGRTPFNVWGPYRPTCP
jgi:hypothetical protein